MSDERTTAEIVSVKNAKALLAEIEKLQARQAETDAKFEEQTMFLASVQSTVATLSDQVMGLLVSRAQTESVLAVLTEQVAEKA